jgi:hypothetical protein
MSTPDSIDVSTPLRDEADIRNVLLYRANPTPDIEAFKDDASSPAAQVARGRGQLTEMVGEPLVEHEVEHHNREGRVYEVSLRDGRLNFNTEYMMRFISESLVESNLTPLDLLTIPDIPSYPLTESAYNALPYAVQAVLEDRGFAKIQGVYDRDAQQFYGTKRGWDHVREETDVAERIQEITAEVGSFVKAADYVYVREADDRWTAELLAKNRGVSEKAVMRNVRNVDEMLNG